MAKDIVSDTKKKCFLGFSCFLTDLLDWRIHELAEPEFEQGRFRRRRYRQEMRQLNMQPTPMHHATYGHRPVSNYYSSPNPYYMCSSSIPSYHTIYSTSNNSMGTHLITSPTLENNCLPSSTSNSYPIYDPYSVPYYPAHYQSMASSYTSPNESISFGAE